MIAVFMFLAVIACLLAGFPVAFTLSGTALLFALGGAATGVFDTVFLETMPSRVFGIMTNGTLVAVPLFVFMGVTLERARIAAYREAGLDEVVLAGMRTPEQLAACAKALHSQA